MAAPTTAFKTFPRASVATLLDTAAERIDEFNNSTNIAFSAVDTGVNPLDFGTVDISGGAANSLVFYLTWKASTNGGNTTADNFNVWCENTTDWGFTLAGTNLNLASMKFEVGGANGQLYTANAAIGSYTWAAIDVAGAPGQNAYSGAGATSVDITTIDTSDDIVGVALYLEVANGETTGTYTGVATAGKEFRGSFRYDYS